MKNYKQVQFIVGALVLGAFIYAPLAFAESDGQLQDGERSQVNISVERGDHEGDSHETEGSKGSTPIAFLNTPSATGTATSTDTSTASSSATSTTDSNGRRHDEEKSSKLEHDKSDANDIEDDSFDGEEYAHEVGSSTQQLLRAANGEKSEVKDEIQKIATEQVKKSEDVAAKIDEVKNRSTVASFLVGADTEKIGQLRDEMVKTSAHIDRLNNLVEKSTDPETKAAIQDQVKVLSTEQQKIGDLLLAKEGKFSLFGWFFKLFGN